MCGSSVSASRVSECGCSTRAARAPAGGARAECGEGGAELLAPLERVLRERASVGCVLPARAARVSGGSGSSAGRAAPSAAACCALPWAAAETCAALLAID
jgi:hypothetical protein